MDNLTAKRFEELSQRAFDKNYITCTAFLNMDEISTLKGLRLPTAYSLFGGYNAAERCIACFGEIPDSYTPPIVCIKIAPANAKFADSLTHRDFLGALLNLGIERSVLGDILIDDNCGYLFCLDSISDYIAESLCRVKHTTVKCTVMNELPVILSREPESREINVSSPRADALVAAVFHLSRNATSALFHQGKVFINSRLCEKESTLLKESDVVSVRGSGRFLFDGVIRATKKDRLVISIKTYQ